MLLIYFGNYVYYIMSMYVKKENIYEHIKAFS